MLADEDEEKPIKTETSQPIKTERIDEDGPIKAEKGDTDIAVDMMNELEALKNAPPPQEKKWVGEKIQKSFHFENELFNKKTPVIKKLMPEINCKCVHAKNCKLKKKTNFFYLFI